MNPSLFGSYLCESTGQTIPTVGDLLIIICGIHVALQSICCLAPKYAVYISHSCDYRAMIYLNIQVVKGQRKIISLLKEQIVNVSTDNSSASFCGVLGWRELISLPDAENVAWFSVKEDSLFVLTNLQLRLCCFLYRGQKVPVSNPTSLGALMATGDRHIIAPVMGPSIHA